MRLFADTSHEAEAVLIELLRQKTPAQRLHMMQELNQHVRSRLLVGIRKRHPGASADEVSRRLGDIMLGAPVASEVYGPDAPGMGAAAGKFKVQISPMDHSELTEVTVLVVDIFERLAIPYFIGGSVASTAYGIARSTLDSDIVADLRADHVAEFLELVVGEFYVSPTAAVDAIAFRSSFNLIHLRSAFKVDIFVAKDRPFERAQFSRSSNQILDPESGRVANFASAEDIILAKLEWYRQGGEQSDRQWQDMLGIVAVQDDLLDWEYMQSMAETLQVGDLLERLWMETRA